jgi:hypothetical protein
MPEINLEDPEDIQDRVKFREIIKNSNGSTTDKALDIIFTSMTRNFNKISGTLHQHSGNLATLELRMALQEQHSNTFNNFQMKCSETRKDVEEKVEKFDKHVKMEEFNTTRLFFGFGIVGVLASTLIILQIINLLIR